MGNEDKSIQVIYALPDEQYVFLVDVQKELTILQALQLSGILDYYTEINLDINKVGIYGVIKQLSDLASPGDRIEIYRELVVDPMEARRIRASKQKKFNKN
jgi:putative ubiquitin-RnfH superfamily antitoxin RatB of RatAB toxin-antitoxin module